MENKLTADQALSNLAFVIEKQFRGTRDEHIALQESLELLKSSICKCKEDPKPEEDKK
jgi:hypothetical protein